MLNQTKLASVCQQQRAEQTSSHVQGSPIVPLPCRRAGFFLWLNAGQINKVSIKKATCCQEGEGTQLLVQQQKRTCRKSEAAPCRVTSGDNFFCCCSSSEVSERDRSGFRAITASCGQIIHFSYLSANNGK